MVFEGVERLPEHPVIIATNATHKFDLFPIRAAVIHRGRNLGTTVSKGKNWHDPVSAWGCDKLGSLPLMSRGYLLSMDFKAVHQRRPTDAEYRHLRDHLDQGAPLPEGEVYEALQHRPRAILGAAFDPGAESWRAGMERIYQTFQQGTLEQARRAIEQGRHLHMYPQGTVSKRLARGRKGIVMLARALDLEVVPVGVSGAPEFFTHPKLPLPAWGRTLTMRVGEPYRLALGALPEDFRPFHPEDERRHGAVLQGAVDDLMERINLLLDAPYRWAPDRESDGAQGVRRFV